MGEFVIGTDPGSGLVVFDGSEFARSVEIDRAPSGPDATTPPAVSRTQPEPADA